MSNSLKDQLLGLGFKPAPKPERKPEASVRPSPKAVQPKTTDRIRHGGKPKPRKTREEIDLARAVYFTNDRRAEIKKQINLQSGSNLVEEKSYQDYT